MTQLKIVMEMLRALTTARRIDGEWVVRHGASRTSAASLKDAMNGHLAGRYGQQVSGWSGRFWPFV